MVGNELYAILVKPHGSTNDLRYIENFVDGVSKPEAERFVDSGKYRFHWFMVCQVPDPSRGRILESELVSVEEMRACEVDYSEKISRDAIA